MFKYKTCEQAAMAGDLDELQKLHENGFDWDVDTPAGAALGGHLDCLRYAHENGCEWNWKTPASAAKAGDLECLRYAHENGCEWNKLTTSWASLRGHIECLKYAHENGCEWTRYTTANAAEYGQIDCLVYAHENGCDWDEMTPANAAQGGHLECLKYAHENGCKWDETTPENASSNGHIECLEYAIKNNCPKNTPAINFILKSQCYINSLNKADIQAINMYTGNYFFRAINAKEQDLLNMELLPENWQENARQYCKTVGYDFDPETASFTDFVNFVSFLIDHINKVINNAPELTDEIIVYRGVETPYFLYDWENNPTHSFVHKGFLSTSLSIDIAKEFAEKDDNLQYMLQSTLKVGTKCIYYPTEKEVILPLNTQVKILYKFLNSEYQGYYEVEYL